MERQQRKSGPRTVFQRELTGTWRVSALFKEIVAAGAARTGLSEGDFVELLGRKCGPRVTRDDVPADERQQPAA